MWITGEVAQDVDHWEGGPECESLGRWPRMWITGEVVQNVDHWGGGPECGSLGRNPEC